MLNGRPPTVLNADLNGVVYSRTAPQARARCVIMNVCCAQFDGVLALCVVPALCPTRVGRDAAYHPGGVRSAGAWHSLWPFPLPPQVLSIVTLGAKNGVGGFFTNGVSGPVNGSAASPGNARYLPAMPASPPPLPPPPAASLR